MSPVPRPRPRHPRRSKPCDEDSTTGAAGTSRDNAPAGESPPGQALLAEPNQPAAVPAADAGGAQPAAANSAGSASAGAGTAAAAAAPAASGGAATKPAAGGAGGDLDSYLHRYRYQRGLNVGGWFTSENWIVNEQYAGAQEPKQADIDIAKGQDAKANYEKHWDSWMNEDDWKWIADHGYNSIRLPISYYHLSGVRPDILEGTDYAQYGDVYSGAWERIVQAVNDANSHGLGVLVDLHAVPGAQNKDAHSGLSDGSINFLQKDTNKAKGIAAMTFLASFFANNTAVVGFELLNEPGANQDWKTFYDEAIPAIRKEVNNDFPLYVGDAWSTDDYAKYVGGRDDFTVLDAHVYRCFAAHDKAMGGVELAEQLTGEYTKQFEGYMESTKDRLVVAEWSAQLDDASIQISGKDKIEQYSQFATAELNTFARGSGNWFWTYKTSGDNDAWSAKTATDKGVLPQSASRGKHQNCDKTKAKVTGDADAFSQGWDDAEYFFKQNDEIGFISELAKRRMADLGKSGDQWIAGYKAGAGEAKKACWNSGIDPNGPILAAGDNAAPGGGAPPVDNAGGDNGGAN